MLFVGYTLCFVNVCSTDSVVVVVWSVAVVPYAFVPEAFGHGLFNFCKMPAQTSVGWGPLDTAFGQPIGSLYSVALARPTDG